ncbi:division/cell wall cluster transcriptional repressor MraZ [Butyricicoccus porcorum]|uniref:Transcriptional regulator MraZ n=1 Tax=Butyricicoccus porcorum TaxID=1945634 RepID=A0A252F5H1_9FIRM|nr:division/cell wall cluster transcriptional repressor MraZ [Butyricicoccus porcorum]MCI6927239.1 division/cell wall cluster transcriptional repressor MraZ [Butyricicoccus porcorum]MDD6986802.1 division/cell wall cluster transcriptional repressor MraZ [Butyricicoccus porcorum]MDY4482800.1 division/cell wall cluster transcriptional repressor MraZ [Butyricicoccus porcorum]OUM21017.1 division/cell wall cluster transcriptional repressor MraZ [Butyricicoccus porcorum]
MKGEYQHTLDAKGRLFIPAKLREELGDSFVVTKGLDECLFLYPLDAWKALEDKIRQLPMSKSRNLQRFFLSAAADVTVDKQGRIVVPPVLRSHAKLVHDVTIIGVLDRAEIWDRQKWDEYNGQLDAGSIAEAMEDLGF